MQGWELASRPPPPTQDRSGSDGDTNVSVGLRGSTWEQREGLMSKQMVTEGGEQGWRRDTLLRGGERAVCKKPSYL